MHNMRGYMRLLLVNNRDSFVYNIVQLLRESMYAPDFDVADNERIPFDETGLYDGMILSPGPGIPSEAGRMTDLIGKCAGTHPLLGICLGHQAIVEHFGGRILNMPFPLHGHRTSLHIADPADPLLAGVREGEYVGRYHSWTADAGNIPSCLMVSSFDKEGNVMSVRHVSLPVFGLQFHPESYISKGCGARILDNWLACVDGIIKNKNVRQQEVSDF